MKNLILSTLLAASLASPLMAQDAKTITCVGTMNATGEFVKAPHYPKTESDKKLLRSIGGTATCSSTRSRALLSENKVTVKIEAVSYTELDKRRVKTKGGIRY